MVYKENRAGKNERKAHKKHQLERRYKRKRERNNGQIDKQTNELKGRHANG